MGRGIVLAVFHSGLVIPLLLCALACSVDGSPLLSSNAGSNGAGSGGASGSGATGGTGGDAGSSGTGGLGGSGGNGAVGGVGGGDAAVVDSGAVADSGADASTRDATVSADGGPGIGTATPGSFVCGEVPCSTSASLCCIGDGLFPTGCFPIFPGCVNPIVTTQACDDAADCLNGETCCGGVYTAPSGMAVGAACKTATSCSGGELQLCRTNAECASGTCTVIPETPNYGRCQ